MKKVVTISELQNLIPETLGLEGVNFQTVKDLLIAVINKIEESNKWKFVQYLSGKPALFIIEQIPDTQRIYQSADPFTMKEEIESHYNTEPPVPPAAEKTKHKKETQVKEDHEEKKYNASSENELLFPKTFMPW